MKTAIIITNYNMPERTDALATHIRTNVKSQYELIIVDNGSDLIPPAKSTTLRLEKNVQTTNGWLMGLHYADALEAISGEKFDAYWFLITSTELVTPDPLTPMVETLENFEYVVGVHSMLTKDSTTHWEHLKEWGKTWFIDNISSLYRADWFNSIGRFDPNLIYAWGIDLETSYIARTTKKLLWVEEDSVVRKITDVGYRMERMNMSAQDRQAKASANMEDIFRERYGHTWKDLMYNEY